MARQIKNMEEFNAALKDAGDTLVVVAYTATWCGPCQKITPTYLALSESPEYEGVIFLRVDVDKAQDVTDKAKISILPTFKFFQGGSLVAEFSGGDAEKLKDHLADLK